MQQESSVRLEDILMISLAREGFVESIRDALNYFGFVYDDFEETTLAEARSIFEVFSISRRNTELLAQPAAPLPLISIWVCHRTCSGDGLRRALILVLHH